MNKNTGVVIGIIVLVVVAVGIYGLMDSKDDVMKQQAMEDQKMAEEKAIMEKKAMEEKEAAMKKDEVSMEKADTMMKTGSYEAYSPEKVMLASSTHDVVLFFRAPWCPTCRALDADIKANIQNIPARVTILDVNYDNSTALKQKYGVTYQHTLVQVDSSGNQIAKWMGSPTLASLVTNIK